MDWEFMKGALPVSISTKMFPRAQTSLLNE
jgi:hypothetical protein